MRVQSVGSRDRGAIRRFVRFPFNVHGEEKNWVPHFGSEIRSFITRKHPFFNRSDAAFFLVSKAGEDLGRIAVLDHEPFNALHGEKTGFFYYFDAFDNRDAANMLFDVVIEWASDRGLTRLIGPKGFMRSSGQGILVEGFEYFPATGIAWNPPYYAELLETAGFAKLTDLFSGYMDYSETGDERLYRVADIARKRGSFDILAFNNRREVLPWLPELKSVQHEAFKDNPNYVPSTDEEFNAMAKNLARLADFNILRFITRKGSLAGFLFAYPNVGQGIKRAKGELLPFGWVRILRERKKSFRLDLNGIGILPAYQKQGGDAILYSELERLIRPSRYTSAEAIQIDENNFLSKSGIEHFSIQWVKRHRVYEKNIGGTG